MTRAKVPSHTRRQIAMLVAGAPGLCTREVARAADVSDATASYHLHRLVRAGEVLTERVGRATAHYPKGWGDATARKVRALSADVRVAFAVLEDAAGPRRPVDVERATGLTRGGARWALALLAREGLARRVAVGKYEVVT